jgi:glycosyltransferase involved in cell wall biosynthesis
MKVLQLISSGGHYGAENMLLNLSVGLQKTGEDVTVAIFENAQNPNLEVAERLREKGIEVEVVRCGGRFDLAAVRSLRAIIGKRSIDIVHSHGYKADLYALAATRGTKVLLVATCHNWPGKSLALRVYAVLDRLGLRYFAHIACVSEEVSKRLGKSGVATGKTTLIPNGIDTQAFQYATPAENIRTNRPGEILVGVVGRLVREKGCEVLLRAAAEIADEFPELRIVIVGEGPERASLEQQANELGLGRRVHFAGKRQDMPGIFASFDIFVLPSFGEGMPMAVLEAMAAGKAIIATKVGEIPKLLLNEDFGLLVQPNHVGELRDALARLLRDCNLRESMGRNGVERVVLLFSLERMTDAYRALYRDLAATPASGAANAKIRETPRRQAE